VAVASENKFVEVVVKVIMAGGSLVGTHQPSLEKGDDTVGARQQVFAFRLIPLHLSIGQIKIGWQPIRSHGAAWLNGLSNKVMRGHPRYIWNAMKAYAPNAIPIFFNGDGYQGFILG
jgi:hypothetical protein